MAFTHLHVHSDFSLLDGLGSNRRTVQIASSLGFNHLALTDHGTLGGAIQFSIEAEQANIKPILGVEGYIFVDGKIGHITLLADGDVGFSSLIRLQNIAHQSNHKQPAFTVDELLANSDGLVCLSGCAASPFHFLDFQDALSLASKFIRVFDDRFFWEAMLVGEDLYHYNRVKALAEATNRVHKMVITNDVHFAKPSDAPVHPILTEIRAKGFSYDSSNLYLASEDDLKRRGINLSVDANELQASINRAWAIGNKIKTPNLKAQPTLPLVTDADRQLQTEVDICLNAKTPWNGFHKPTSMAYAKRLNIELGVIQRMGYSTYFLILVDLINFAKQAGVRIGAGRGSGAGSLVLYLLGITDVDPLVHGLQFERFLNEERKGMPDVDVDLDSVNRHKVIEYASQKYGGVPISTYSKYSHKSLIRDLGRSFNIPRSEVDKLSERGEESKLFKQLLATNPDLEHCYDVMSGQVRHKGKHAGGVIITDREVPIERTARGGDSELATSWTEGENNELSYAGIVKFDLLGLSALSVLNDLETETGIRAEQPEDGHAVFEIFKTGDVAGIFQFSGSQGIRDLTRKIAPERFSDLAVISALYRPGPLDSGMADQFPEYKSGNPRQVPEIFELVLTETYGVIVYQEQMMEVYQIAVGGSLAEADLARRTIVKKGKSSDPKDKAEIANLGIEFVQGCMNQGLSEKESKDFWDEIVTFARYGFNKSHAVAYSMISWEMAWWKFNHRAKFYAAMLNHDPANMQSYIYDVSAGGYQISPPHVNYSLATSFTADDTTIYLPLNSVKFLGNKTAEAIVGIREDVGQYITYEDLVDAFPKKLFNRRHKLGLHAVNAFDGLKGKLSDLGVDKNDFTPKKEILSIPTQKEWLGFIIPNQQLFNDMKHYENLGWKAGIIDKIKTKRSSYNNSEYRVFFLLPEGVFWSRDLNRYEEGMAIGVKIGARGKAIKAKEIKL